MKTSLALTAIAFTFTLATSAEAALVSRLNGQAVYDTDLNITWTADANLPTTLSFGLDVEPDGSMWGYLAESWIASLNSYEGTGYLGFSDWRLTVDNCAATAGHNCTESEFGHLFYNELGGTAYSPISASGNPNLPLFTNIVEDWYWTGSVSSGHMKVFNFADGANSRTFGTLAKYRLWAVRDGDVAPVPVPGAFWLFGFALAVLFGASRRRNSAVPAQ